MARTDTEPVEFDRQPVPALVTEETKPDIEGFLTRLQALSDEFGIYIDGCGCDGSPWLETADLSQGQIMSDISTQPKADNASRS